MNLSTGRSFSSVLINMFQSLMKFAWLSCSTCWWQDRFLCHSVSDCCRTSNLYIWLREWPLHTLCRAQWWCLQVCVIRCLANSQCLNA